ncbi:MAG: hypothetical protein ACR2NT_16295, partial [Acidimicrobiia bacterium]
IASGLIRAPPLLGDLHHRVSRGSERQPGIIVGLRLPTSPRSLQSFDFGDLVELAFQDTDLDMLFDPASDGIEGSDIAEHLGARHLHPDRWFEPFYEDIAEHLYVS